MKFNHQFLFVAAGVAFFLGCQGDESRPTLDYAPENVDTIRELQGLKMPNAEDEAASSSDDASDEAEEASDQ